MGYIFGDYFYVEVAESGTDTTTGWQKAGNTVNNPSDFLGSINNASLNLKTNNIQRATILGDGNVGIGTATPNAPLHVFGITPGVIYVDGNNIPGIQFLLNGGRYGQIGISGSNTNDYFNNVQTGDFNIRSDLTNIHIGKTGYVTGTNQEVIDNMPNLNITAKDQIGINTVTPHASATLDIVSNNKGLLIPRLTTLQRDSIVSPATSLLIFNSTLNLFQYYNASVWAGIGGGSLVKQIHTAGATIGLNNTTSWLIIKPALSALTITLAATPADGQRIDISFKLAVTSVTIAPNSGQTIKDANGVTAVQAGESIAYQYDSGDLIWYRL